MNQHIKTGFVSIIGRPNVGKSTLVNALVDDKVSIMSDKPQTTRNSVKGIFNDNEAQIIFLDTPGMQSPRNKLGKYMERASHRSLGDADVILYVVDESDYIGRKDKEIIELLRSRKEPIILIINKVDMVNHELLMKNIVMYDQLNMFAEIIPVSALKKKNHEIIIEILKNYLPEGPRYFSEKQTTDQPNKVLISEIIREKILLYTEEEIPHGAMVEIERLQEKNNNVIDIGAIIYVERESHKKIIIGKGGRKIKGIGVAARKELEEKYEARVNLELWVKVKDNWRDNDNYIKNFGFSEKE